MVFLHLDVGDAKGAYDSQRGLNEERGEKLVKGYGWVLWAWL